MAQADLIRMTYVVDANMEGLRRSLKKGEASAAQFGKKITMSAKGAQSRFNALASTINRTLLPALGGLALVGLASTVSQYTDAWKEAEARLINVGGVTKNLVAMQEKLFDLAQRTRSDLLNTVNAYSQLSLSMREMGASSQDVIRVTETLNKALVVGGATTQQAAAVQLQFKQAIASDRLGGDEFRSLSENAPRLMLAIADGLGVGIGALKEMSRQGKLTADTVLAALAKSAAGIDKEFSRIPLTISQAGIKINNAFTRYIGEADKAVGASAIVSKAMDKIANNFDQVADAAILLGYAFGTRLVARGIGPMVAGMGKSTAAFVTNTVAQRAAAREAVIHTAAQLKGAQAQVVMAAKVQQATGSTVQMRAAIKTATAAQLAHNAAMAQTGVVAAVASRAMVGLRGAMAFLGGPVGLVITGLAAGMAYLSMRTTEADLAQQAHTSAMQRAVEISTDLEMATGKRADALRQEQGELLKTAKMEYEASKAKLESLENHKSKLTGRARAAVPTVNKQIKEEAVQVAKLKDAYEALRDVKGQSDASREAREGEKQQKKFEKVKEGLETEISLVGKSAQQKKTLAAIRRAEVEAGSKEAKTIKELVGELSKLEAAQAANKNRGELEYDNVALEQLIDAHKRGAGAVKELQDALEIERLAKQEGIDFNTEESNAWKKELEKNQRLTESLEAQEDRLKSLQETAENYSRGVASSFEDAATSFIMGSKNGTDAIKGLVGALAQLAVKQVVVSSMANMFGGIFGGGAGGGTGGGGHPSAFASGGVMTSYGQMPLKKYARGGIARSPQVALFGEGSMNEAYVPLPDGHRIPVHMKGGGGGVAVNVNIKNTASNAQVTARQGSGGNIDVLVEGLENKIAQNVAAGNGPMSKALKQRGIGA